VLESALFVRNEDVAELQLTLKHAQSENIVAKREAKKLIR
jgi:hypothetical protein